MVQLRCKCGHLVELQEVFSHDTEDYANVCKVCGKGLYLRSIPKDHPDTYGIKEELEMLDADADLELE